MLAVSSARLGMLAIGGQQALGHEALRRDQVASLALTVVAKHMEYHC